VFSERGYLAASLEQIAEAAGFSKGVVYSQFGSKADLFLAVLEQRIVDRAAANERLVERALAATSLEAFAEMNTTTNRRGARWSLALIEFRVIAARDEELLERYRALHEVTVSRLSDHLGMLFDRYGIAPSVPVRSLARGVLALGAGDALESLVRARSEEFYGSALLLRFILGTDATKEAT
jgi:AcrR family transcriptional regulator